MNTITIRTLTAFLALSMAGCGTAQLVGLVRDYEPRYTDATPVDSTETDVLQQRGSDGRDATLLSAFFGIDNGLPRFADRLIFAGAAGLDGMPVVFSHEVDFGTLQAGDFRVTTESGRTSEILCVTLAPADDPGELRTVLVVGELGSAADQPSRVEIVGDLLALDGSANFKGASVDVIPLEAGPTLEWAEVVPESGWRVGAEATPLPWGGGSGCPPGAKQVVRVTWAGGVTRPGRNEIDGQTQRRYRVALRQPGGGTLHVTPFAVADLGDGDNNHLLCLDAPGTPISVSFPAGFLEDPNADVNPDTSVEVFSGSGSLSGSR
ncbi:MAG: hypothetical protein AAF726_12865 [Planctomycetota bacterium]